MVIIGPRWLATRASRASYERQRDAAAVMSATEESLAAHSVIKAFDLQGTMLAGYGRRLAKLYRSTVHASWLSGLQAASISGSGSILLDHRDHRRRVARRAGRAVRRGTGRRDRPALVHGRVAAGAGRCRPAAAAGRRRHGSHSGSARRARGSGREAGRAAAAALCRRHRTAGRQLRVRRLGAAGALSRQRHDSRRRVDRHRRAERIGQEHDARPVAAPARPLGRGRSPSTATISAA